MDKDDLKHRFSAHEVDEVGVNAMAVVRDAARLLALLINDVAPDGREKSLAITKLEEAVFWANAGIARA